MGGMIGTMGALGEGRRQSNMTNQATTPTDITEQNLTDIPVGLCSRERAQYLMMAAAVAGGAVFTECPEIPGVTVDEDGWDVGYLCCGTMPNGEPVPTRILDRVAVIGAVTAERDKLARLAERFSGFDFDDERDELNRVLDALGGA